MHPIDDLAVDGNALAGRLAEIFADDMTSAFVTCESCGSSKPLAHHRAYVRGPGAVLRCADCWSILGRLVRTPDAYWLDLRGAASLRIPMTS
ncbi:DUF6510 family protein [Kribbella sp. CA-293567]|uniref:DUF6510 family protein n=1 Tax=Kribbella sp. CA-293567 TaxID=3002436 RepID=UPI0022DD4BCA|nr:DUF6510 family protein [Kribbella sp. CA-293567]WBQ08396.1 DUF6510 family protein [Kribbella sp. CA-293567]